MVKKVILDQMEEIDILLKDDRTIERDIKDLSEYLKGPNILSILGVRRAGKSTLALKVARKLGEHGYVNFDDERLYGMGSKELDLLLEAWIEILGEEPDILVLDEIQNIEGWELFVNRMRRRKRIIITGSNANLLEGDLSTHLTGRYIDVHLFPFSFREYLRYRGMEHLEGSILGTSGSSMIRKELAEYLEVGGFPEAYSIGKVMVARIYKDIILKDAILRYGLRNRVAFNDVARYLISNFSREFTYSRVSRVCNISNKNMVSEYISILEEVELLFHLERYSPKLSEQYNSPKKIYCIDPGLVRSIGFNISENSGLLLENVVAIELMRRFRDRDGTLLFYWKDHRQYEVDFVIRRGKKIEKLVQVTYSMDKAETEDRELDSICRASDELGCRDLLIITWNDERKIKRDGKDVVCVPLYKWLLGYDRFR